MFSASAPGSIILLGEHAVLRGFKAVACAIDRKMFVRLNPRKDNKIKINSSILGQHETNLKNLSVTKPFQFILQALLNHQKDFSSGFDLNIDSEFSDKLGLGSSAAVTVATLCVLYQWLYGKFDLESIYEDGVNVIRAVQGMGSGYDVACSVFGGVLEYNIDPVKIVKLPMILKISLIYSGYKTQTPIVIKKVNESFLNEPEIFNELLENIGNCANEGILAIQNCDFEKLGEIFLKHQRLQKLLGVSDETLDEIVNMSVNLPSVFGAKISGSGLGDCVVTLGKLPHNYFPVNEKQILKGVRQIDIKITNIGCEKYDDKN